MFLVKYTKRAEKSLRQIPVPWRDRIVQAIDHLGENPFRGKKLQGRLEKYWSLRVWPYRIIYEIRQQEITVLVLDIGHRRNIYK